MREVKYGDKVRIKYGPFTGTIGVVEDTLWSKRYGCVSDVEVKVPFGHFWHDVDSIEVIEE